MSDERGRHFWIILDAKYDERIGMFGSKQAAQNWADDHWGHDTAYHDDYIVYSKVYMKYSNYDGAEFKTTREAQEGPLPACGKKHDAE